MKKLGEDTANCENVGYNYKVDETSIKMQKNRFKLHKKCSLLNFFKCLIVLGSFIIYFISDGVSLSFGIFIRETMSHFKKNTTQSSLTASLLQSIPLFLSPFVCILIEKLGCRIVAVIGSVLVTISFVITKYFVDNIISLYLTLGCLASCGLAMCYIPAYLIISFYFDKNRAFATGIAVSGSGLGLFAIPPIMEMLIREYGLMDACFIFGAISSHMLISACLFRPIDTQPSNNENIDCNQTPITTEIIKTDEKKVNFIADTIKILKILFLNKQYVLLNVSYSILSFLITSPYNFLPDHVNINSINDENSLSISLIGIATLIGQIVIGFIADKFRQYNWLIYAICLIISGILTCILPFLKNLYLICFYSIAFGFMISVNYVLQSILVIEAVGLDNLTVAFGYLQLMQGVSTLTGTPAVAWIKDQTGNYNITFYVSGAFISLAGACLLLWPLCKQKKR